MSSLSSRFGLSRREFVKSAGVAMTTGGLLSAATRVSAAEDTKVLRVLQIGVGGIGGMDRNNIKSHARAKIVGLCDVDTNTLAKVGEQFPDAFRDTDYRAIFADRKDEFDAVNICSPDHMHAPQIMMSLAHDKHCYAQKPVVQQLEELTLVADAMAKKPHLSTQVGNQRMQSEGRRIAVDILKRGLLGPAVSAYAWANTTRGSATPKELPEAKQPPAHVDWDLWLGAADKQPYRDGIVPNHWRAWWDFGTAGLGDWGVHLLDVIIYSYPELTSPVSVKTDTPRAADWYHSAKCRSKIVYNVKKGERFKNDTFPIYYNDSGQKPELVKLGLPDQNFGQNNTVVVCEGGILVLAAGGKLQVFRDGKPATLEQIGANQDVGPYKHWHNWIDRALGDTSAEVWTPIDLGIKMTEASILPVKASRFPGQELKWDRASLTFTNHQQATDTVVRRDYRDGFGCVKV